MDDQLTAAVRALCMDQPDMTAKQIHETISASEEFTNVSLSDTKRARSKATKQLAAFVAAAPVAGPPASFSEAAPVGVEPTTASVEYVTSMEILPDGFPPLPRGATSTNGTMAVQDVVVLPLGHFFLSTLPDSPEGLVRWDAPRGLSGKLVHRADISALLGGACVVTDGISSLPVVLYFISPVKLGRVLAFLLRRGLETKRRYSSLAHFQEKLAVWTRLNGVEFTELQIQRADMVKRSSPRYTAGLSFIQNSDATVGGLCKGCAWCGLAPPGEQTRWAKCEACKAVCYCCIEHQRAAWKSNHKASCSVLKPIHSRMASASIQELLALLNEYGAASYSFAIATLGRVEYLCRPGVATPSAAAEAREAGVVEMARRMIDKHESEKDGAIKLCSRAILHSVGLSPGRV